MLSLFAQFSMSLVYDSNRKIKCSGFGEIMGTLARIGLFDTEPHPLLKDGKRPSFRTFLLELLNIKGGYQDGPMQGEDNIAERIVKLGYCKDQGAAQKAAKTIL